MELPVSISGITVAVHGAAGQCSTFSLGKGETMRVTAKNRPIRIECLGGVLWVTQPNDPQDHILRRCEAVTLSGPGQIIIEALPRGKACIIAE